MKDGRLPETVVSFFYRIAKTVQSPWTTNAESVRRSTEGAFCALKVLNLPAQGKNPGFQATPRTVALKESATQCFQSKKAISRNQMLQSLS